MTDQDRQWHHLIRGLLDGDAGVTGDSFRRCGRALRGIAQRRVATIFPRRFDATVDEPARRRIRADPSGLTVSVR